MTDFTRKRGDDYPDQFQVLSKTTGLPVDISGYSFLMTIDPDDRPVNSDNNLFQMVGTITNSTSGLVEFQPLASDVDNIGVYYQDIQMTDTAGKIRTVDHGKYEFTQDITK